MILCSTDAEEEEEEEEEVEEGKVNVNEMTAAKKKELYKKFLCNHGSESRSVG